MADAAPESELTSPTFHVRVAFGPPVSPVLSCTPKKPTHVPATHKCLWDMCFAQSDRTVSSVHPTIDDLFDNSSWSAAE